MGRPKEIYTRPANTFVANFIGTSAFLDGKAENGAVSILGKNPVPFTHLNKAFSGDVKVSVRPEYASLSQPKDGELTGTITMATFLGDFMNYEIELENGQIIEINEYTSHLDQPREIGSKVGISLLNDRISVFDAKSEKSLMTW